VRKSLIQSGGNHVLALNVHCWSLIRPVRQFWLFGPGRKITIVITAPVELYVIRMDSESPDKNQVANLTLTQTILQS